MKKALNTDLKDLTDILESISKTLDKLSESDLIDLAARLKPVAKHCETIDKFTKDYVKEKLHHREGTVKGDLFVAELALVPVNRLDQKALKEEEPDTHAAYLKADTDERVSFKLR